MLSAPPAAAAASACRSSPRRTCRSICATPAGCGAASPWANCCRWPSAPPICREIELMSRAQQAAQAICAALDRATAGWRPQIGLILGSGLGPVADGITPTLALPYDQIPGFPCPSVEGHAGRLVLGVLGGARVRSE